MRQPPARTDAKALADGLMKGTIRSRRPARDRTTREKIAQLLAADRPASLTAAKRVVGAQTPVLLGADDAETLTDGSEPAEPLWSAEASLDEPSLEQE